MLFGIVRIRSNSHAAVVGHNQTGKVSSPLESAVVLFVPHAYELP